MKRFIHCIILILALVFVFTGCSKTSQVHQKQSQPEAEVNDQQDAKRYVESSAEAIEDQDNSVPIESSKSENYEAIEGTLETIDYDSKAISENLINETTEQQLYVYLPPSYSESDKKYPVVYFLHGYGDSPLSFIKYAKTTLDPIFSGDYTKEFIVVAVDGTNSTGGSYYVNSPVTGNWGDYTSKEAVAYIDSNYRTIAKAESRGICGFSMGGYGALHLAFLFPDIYSCVYSMSPGALAPGKIGDALDTWRYDKQFLQSYSLAFAYNKEAPYETLPLRDGSEADNLLLKRWEAGFGNWEEKIEAYLSLKTPLRAIGFSCGTNDNYGWIPEGTIYLSDLLRDKGVSNLLYSFDGGHVLPPNTMEDHLLPFFQEALAWEE